MRRLLRKYMVCEDTNHGVKVTLPIQATIANGIYKVVIIQKEHIVKTIKLNVVQ